MKIWTLDDDQIDKIVDTYIDYVTNPMSFHRQTPKWKNQYVINNNHPPEKRALKYDKSTQASMDFGDNNLPVIIDNLPKPQRLKIRAHFISLIHLLYLRHVSTVSGEIIFSSEILQRVYRYYNFMLDAIRFRLIIYRTRDSVGDFARDIFYMNEEIEKTFKYIDCENRIVIEDIEKIKNEFEKLHVLQIKKAKEKTSSKFIDDYNKSLKSFCFKNNKEVYDLIENYSFKSNHSKLYYKNILQKIEENKIKEIERTDENGRIYHIVTQTPKLLRKYSNIQFIIDTKNSHPLLFNYFIFEYYFNNNFINIKNNNFKNNNNLLYFYISDYIYNKYNNHYSSKDLCNHLIVSGIESCVVDIVKRIPKDIWEYIYSTSHGKLWDEINQANPEFSRTEIKVEMFSSLFYSYAKNISKKKIYARAFQDKYPTASKIIRYYKRIYHGQCIKEEQVKNKNGLSKDKIQLAHKLMQFESFIFTEILTQLYKKKTFRGVGIHDAIAVFDGSTSPEDVISLMRDVYFGIGLCPTFSIEKSDSDYSTNYVENDVNESGE